MSCTMRIKKTKQVKAGKLLIGGDSPVSIQSMTNLPIENITGTISQINELENAGADIVRLAILNSNALPCFKEIVRGVNIPLVADIHFDHRLAIGAIEAGASKIRINPGNIGADWKVKEVVKAAEEKGIPVRIGVNGGSINRKKYTHVTPEALIDSAMDNIHIFEENHFSNIVVSIKSSDIFHTIEANRMISEIRDYPVHIGLTEAGFGLSCLVRSSIVIGNLLMSGIGNTIRVSMTGDPVNEIYAGKKILETLSLRFSPVKIISCPTCGRTSPELNLLEIAEEAEKQILADFGAKLEKQNRSITVAIMGCEVNGPGEAREADFGLAGGRSGSMLLFAKGETVKKVQAHNALNELLKAISDSF